jgi:hypothetical protein
MIGQSITRFSEICPHLPRLFVSSIALLVLTVGCANRDVPRLATITSDHVNRLNGEMKRYVDLASAGRAEDAARIASARSRWDQDSAVNQQRVTTWEIDSGAIGSRADATKALHSYEILQKQSAADMARTDSYLKRQRDAQAQLEASYGTVTYDPAKLEDVVAQLQALAKREETGVQLQLNAAFAAAVLSDVKNDLDAAKPNPKGVGK